MLHVEAHEIVVATGAAEVHPVCPGNRLGGLVTARAAERLHGAGVDLGRTVAVGTPPAGVPVTAVAGRLVGFEGGAGRVSAVHTEDPATGALTTTPADTVVLGLGLAPRDLLARMAGPVPVTVVGDAAVAEALPPAPVEGRRVRLHGHDRGRPAGGVGPRLHRARAPQAFEPGVSRDLPGRSLPPERPRLDRGADRRGAGAVHGPSGVAPDHIGRGRRRRLRRRLPPDTAPRRAPGARGADGPVRGLVAAVALRRRCGRVLGGPRRGVDRRRLDPRQAGRVRAGRGRAAGAAVPMPRGGHQARPLALRAPAQRARPRHGRRDDPARLGDPVRAVVHVRRRRQRRDVGPRLGRHVGASRPRPGSDDVARRDQRHGTARRGAASAGRARRPTALPGPCPHGGLRCPVPRHAPVVHRRGRLRAAPPGRSVGRALAGPDDPRCRPRDPAARPPGPVRAAPGEGPRHRRDGHRAGHHAAPDRDGLGGPDGQAAVHRPGVARADGEARGSPPLDGVHDGRSGPGRGGADPGRWRGRRQRDGELALPAARPGADARMAAPDAVRRPCRDRRA